MPRPLLYFTLVTCSTFIFHFATGKNHIISSILFRKKNHSTLPRTTYIFCHSSAICPDGTATTFELITGAIFMMEQGKINQFQTFDIDECFQACRNNTSCYSANFETGLCTTSQFNASSMPDSLRTDDFPVFPNYLEKVCLRKPDETRSPTENSYYYST